MNVEFSKAFVKASKRLSGKMLDSLRRTIVEVKAAKGIQDISDCKKLVGYRNIYRIRLGDYRALFTLEIEFSGDTIFFQYLAPRGEAYGKKMKTELKRIDKEQLYYSVSNVSNSGIPIYLLFKSGCF